MVILIYFPLAFTLLVSFPRACMPAKHMSVQNNLGFAYLNTYTFPWLSSYIFIWLLPYLFLFPGPACLLNICQSKTTWGSPIWTPIHFHGYPHIFSSGFYPTCFFTTGLHACCYLSCCSIRSSQQQLFFRNICYEDTFLMGNKTVCCLPLLFCFCFYFACNIFVGCCCELFVFGFTNVCHTPGILLFFLVGQNFLAFAFLPCQIWLRSAWLGKNISTLSWLRNYISIYNTSE